MLPDAGCSYVYVREAFGPLPAFLLGWTLFLAINTGSTATLAVAFANYLGELVALTPPAHNIAGVAMIAAVTAVNIRGVRHAATVQNWSTALKVGAIVALALAGFALGDGFHRPDMRMFTTPPSLASFSAAGVALLGVLWAYEGWQNVTNSAGEAADPQRACARGIGLGTAALVAISLTANAGYVAAVGASGVAATDRIAADVVHALFGPAAAKLVTLVILVSIFSAANGLALTGPRMYFAMARDGVFFRALAQVHPRFGTPALAVLVSATWAALLAISGTFEQLRVAAAASRRAAPVPGAGVSHHSGVVHRRRGRDRGQHRGGAAGASTDRARDRGHRGARVLRVAVVATPDGAFHHIPRMIPRPVPLVATALTALGSSALGQSPRPTTMAHRSTVYAPHGMIATSQPLATAAGLAALERGGNAIDAAVTAAAVLNVAEPMMTGIGGDVFAIVWSAKDHKLYGLNSSGRAGRLMTRDALLARGHRTMPTESVEDVTVPGALAGWQALLQRFGTITLSQALAPAIGYAEHGFPVTLIIARDWAAEAARLARDDCARATFLVDGTRAPRDGEGFTKPDLARSLPLGSE